MLAFKKVTFNNTIKKIKYSDWKFARKMFIDFEIMSV